MKHAVATLAAMLALAACSPRSARTVEWYVQHSDDRAETISECRRAGHETHDCRNAARAETKILSERRGLVPLKVTEN